MSHCHADCFGSCTNRLAGTILACSWVALSLLTIVGPAVAGELRPLREGTELFVDDHQVESASNLTRVIHQALKLDKPVVVPDKPWEGNRTAIQGTVLRDRDSGQLQMWYAAGGLAFATSADGVHWDKPELPYVQHEGRPTNLLFTGGNLNVVIYDPDDPDASKRYKGLDSKRPGLHDFLGYYSADGFVWHEYETSPLLNFGSENISGMRDPATGKYLLFVRPHPPKPFPTGLEQKRIIALSTSDDFLHWSKPQWIVTPDDTDDAWVTDPSQQRTEFYGMMGFAYGTQYLGMVPVLWVEKVQEKTDPHQSRIDGPMEAQLVHSRDGMHWERSDPRDSVIARGPYDYDAGCVFLLSSRPVIMGDQVWLYYTGLTTKHGGTTPPKKGAIAVAMWRLDGFASLDAGEQPGVLVTKPIAGRGGVLEVNADAGRGSVTVEMIDASGNAIADSVTLTGDSVRHRVYQQAPSNRAYRLRFTLTHASLYSYTIRDREAAESSW